MLIHPVKGMSNLLSFDVTETNNTVNVQKKGEHQNNHMCAAAIVAFIMLYEILKLEFHIEYCDVSAKREGGIELTQREEQFFRLKVY